MPYHIGEKGSHGCAGFPVVKDSDGEVMGCHKTEDDAKKQLAALYANEPEASKMITKADGHVPPQQVRSNAKRGLELREKYGRGGTEVGVARARDLSNGKAVSLDTIKRMNSYFSRHEVDKKGEGWGKDSAGYIAWLLWGGDAGWSWAKGILRKEESKEKAMAMDYTTGYASIVKYDKNDDGTLMVFGKATDDTLDLDAQICDPKWLDEAMPQWFKSGGNIREMHGPSAAGVAKEYEAKSDGHYIGVHVVDPIAVKKVEARVYTGFSIGIKSPRVVRDEKAANGRIIDGQIIEVSLVDRPANPSAKLILAKAVDGETSLVQVEELHEYKAPLPSDVAKMTEKGSKMETIKQITELAKSLTPIDSAKFDKTLFDNARRALAELIASEALEMTEGHDERNSLAALVGAVHALMSWYEGEEREGEVEEIVETVSEKAADDSDADGEAEAEEGKAADPTSAGCDCEGCKECKADGGCDDKMCKSHIESKAVHKCLECGCGQVTTTHGLSQVVIPSGSNPNPMVAPANVTTAEIVDYTKSADAEEATEEVAEEVKEVSEAVEAEESTSIEDVVEKAVKSAMASVKAEIDTLRAEKESAVEKSVKLESELATALSKAVAGGPKRTASATVAVSNEYLVKAATYKAKADATTDPVLAKGYRDLANEFYAKAAPKAEN